MVFCRSTGVIRSVAASLLGLTGSTVQPASSEPAFPIASTPGGCLGKAAVRSLNRVEPGLQWTARTELERRCGDTLDEYDAKHPTSKSKAAKKLHAGTPLDVLQPQPTVVEQDSPPEIVADEHVSHLPDQARLSMGVWSYGRKVKTRGSKGTKVVWKDASHYTRGT